MKGKKEKKKSLLHVNLYLQNLYPEEIAGNWMASEMVKRKIKSSACPIF